MSVSVFIWLGKSSFLLVIRIASLTLFSRCVNLLALPDDVEFLRTARTIYRQQGKYAQALNLSIRVGEMDLIKEDFEQCPDP